VSTLLSLLTGKNDRKSYNLVRNILYLIDSVHLSCICAWVIMRVVRHELSSFTSGKIFDSVRNYCR
jgi:hypothetical protein